MKWVKPTEEMPARYKVVLFVIDYPRKDRPLTITTGIYTGEQYGWYADFNGKHLDTDQIKYWAPIASLPKDY